MTGAVLLARMSGKHQVHVGAHVSAHAYQDSLTAACFPATSLSYFWAGELHRQVKTGLFRADS
jgi:hypothetical protein